MPCETYGDYGNYTHNAYTCGDPDVQIPAGVTQIPECCFDHCEDLKSIQIPETVTNIDQCAIYACKKLKELNVPASVTSIGKFNFTKAVLHVTAGSCAERYAQENNKRYVVE